MDFDVEIFDSYIDHILQCKFYDGTVSIYEDNLTNSMVLQCSCSQEFSISRFKLYKLEDRMYKSNIGYDFLNVLKLFIEDRIKKKEIEKKEADLERIKRKRSGLISSLEV